MVERPLLDACRGMAALRREGLDGPELAFFAYTAVYACGYRGRGRLARFEAWRLALLDVVFLTRLAAAVGDARSAEDGWRVRGEEGGRVLLERGGVRAVLPRAELADPAALISIGEPARCEVTAFRPGAAPGFAVRCGRRRPFGEPLSRVYLDLRASSAAWALGPLAHALDERGLPFDLKVMGSPRAYGRRDGGVLYVPSARLPEAMAVVRRAIEHGRPALGPGAPLFTRPLGRGVAFADEPSDLQPEGQVRPVQSHGQWVSGLLMAADPEAQPRELAREVLAAVAAAGRDPARPWLRAGRDEPVFD
jgi:hypothetical protein